MALTGKWKNKQYPKRLQWKLIIELAKSVQLPIFKLIDDSNVYTFKILLSRLLTLFTMKMPSSNYEKIRGMGSYSVEKMS